MIALRHLVFASIQRKSSDSLYGRRSSAEVTPEFVHRKPSLVAPFGPVNKDLG